MKVYGIQFRRKLRRTVVYDLEESWVCPHPFHNKNNYQVRNLTKQQNMEPFVRRLATLTRTHRNIPNSRIPHKESDSPFKCYVYYDSLGLNFKKVVEGPSENGALYTISNGNVEMSRVTNNKILVWNQHSTQTQNAYIYELEFDDPNHVKEIKRIYYADDFGGESMYSPYEAERIYKASEQAHPYVENEDLQRIHGRSGLAGAARNRQNENPNLQQDNSVGDRNRVPGNRRANFGRNHIDTSGLGGRGPIRNQNENVQRAGNHEDNQRNDAIPERRASLRSAQLLRNAN